MEGILVNVKLGTELTTFTLGVPEIVVVNVGNDVNVRLGTLEVTFTNQGFVPCKTVTLGRLDRVRLGTVLTTLTVGVPVIVVVNAGRDVSVRLGTVLTTFTGQALAKVALAAVPWLTVGVLIVTVGSDVNVKFGTEETTLTVGVPVMETEPLTVSPFVVGA